MSDRRPKKAKKEVDLKKRAWFAIKCLFIPTIGVILAWIVAIIALRANVDFDVVILLIAISVTATQLWILAHAVTGFFNISLFKLLGMKERPTCQLF